MQKISEENLKKMKVALRAGKKTYQEIANDLGVKRHVVNYWSRKVKNNPEKETPKIIRRPAAVHAPTPAHRPMIALVGTADEVTASIRELFS